MQIAPIPKDEKIRQKVVENLQILNTEPEQRFDDITKSAMDFFQVPLSAISILDKKREWYKSCNGMCEAKEGSRDISFCGHALLSEFIFIVDDTKLDERFKDNPYVTGPPFIRFYAGMRLLDYPTKQPIGVFCIKDTKPRTFSATDIAAFIDLASKAEKELNESKIIRTRLDEKV